MSLQPKGCMVRIVSLHELGAHPGYVAFPKSYSVYSEMVSILMG